MNSPHSRLTLERHQVYAWTMYPGYGAYPYRSPMIPLEIKTLGSRKFDLTFLNVFYAPGMQEMRYRLRTLRREATFQIAEVMTEQGPSDRVVIVEPMTRSWVEDFAPDLKSRIDSYFSPDESPYVDAFRQLMSSAF